MQELRPLGLFALSCLIACLTQALPLWLILVSIVGIGLKFWRSLKLPPALLYTMMALLWSLLVFDSPKIMHKNTLTGAIVLATLFTVLSPPHRHRVMRFHVGLFALLVSVLVVPKETYPLWFYFILSTMVCVSLVLHHVQTQSMFSLINFGKSFIKLAIPLTLLLLPVYYFFPEIRNSNMQAQGMSGMSGDLEPGQLASLALSDRLAFRVRFKDDPPIAPQLYWRAEVLEQTRGMRWSQGRAYPSKPVKTSEPNEAISYELMLDYQMNGMLPILEHATSLYQARDESRLTFQSEKNIYRTGSRYLLVGAIPSSNYQQLTPPDMEMPDFEVSPRVQELVETLKAKPAREQVRFLMAMYKGFQYTLQPGKLEKGDQLDEFLFDSKKGYCEHFAASFSSLLRLAGTPARVVIGYQGATQLGASSIYQITNADAHAWSEVWIDGSWFRVDPSSVVLPSESQKKEAEGLTGLITAIVSFWIQHFFDLVQEWSDDIGMIWIYIGVCATGLILIQVYRLRRKKDSAPAWEIKTNHFLKKLEALGQARFNHETVFNYLQRSSIEQDLPVLADLGRLYNLRKFAEDKASETEFEATLAQCKAALPELRRKDRLKKGKSGKGIAA
jgi:transglutaminase-like putative cysteine protease